MTNLSCDSASFIPACMSWQRVGGTVSRELPCTPSVSAAATAAYHCCCRLISGPRARSLSRTVVVRAGGSVSRFPKRGTATLAALLNLTIGAACACLKCLCRSCSRSSNHTTLSQFGMTFSFPLFLPDCGRGFSCVCVGVLLSRFIAVQMSLLCRAGDPLRGKPTGEKSDVLLTFSPICTMRNISDSKGSQPQVGLLASVLVVFSLQLMCATLLIRVCLSVLQQSLFS